VRVRHGFTQNFRGRGDPLIGPQGLLKLADRLHQRDPGVRAGHRREFVALRTPQLDRRQAHQPERHDHHQRHHQQTCHQRESAWELLENLRALGGAGHREVITSWF
jgi:hypothetical protein